MIMANSIKSTVPILVGLTLIGIVGTLGSESTESSPDLFNQLDDPTLDWNKAEEMMLRVKDPEHTMIGKFSLKELLTVRDISEDHCNKEELKKRIGYCLHENVANNQVVLKVTRRYWQILSKICWSQVKDLFSDLEAKLNIVRRRIKKFIEEINRLESETAHGELIGRDELFHQSCSWAELLTTQMYFIADNSYQDIENIDNVIDEWQFSVGLCRKYLRMAIYPKGLDAAEYKVEESELDESLFVESDLEEPDFEELKNTEPEPADLKSKEKGTLMSSIRRKIFPCFSSNCQTKE